MNTTSFDLFQALDLWTKGQLQNNDLLWNWPIFAWERLGKFLLFVSAFTIVADILGAERIRKWGKGLHTTLNINHLISNAFKSVKWTILYALLVIGDVLLNTVLFILGLVALIAPSRIYKKVHPVRVGVFEWAKKINLQRNSMAVQKLGLIIALVTILSILVIIRIFRPIPTNILQSFAAFYVVPLLVVACSIIIGISILIFNIILAVIDGLIIEPLAWILERPALDWWVKVFSVLLLMIGFFFDMLGS